MRITNRKGRKVRVRKASRREEGINKSFKGFSRKFYLSSMSLGLTH